MILEYKDEPTSRVFQSSDEYYDWLYDQGIMGIRHCTITEFDGKAKKQILCMTDAITDCSSLRYLYDLRAQLHKEQEMKLKKLNDEEERANKRKTGVRGLLQRMESFVREHLQRKTV